jgi:ADP-ribosyl-[dinitrogen reductase] hydrolase
VPMYFHSDISAAERYAAESSRTTHAARECVDACRLFARMIVRALRGASKEEALLGDRESFSGASSINAIARGTYLEKNERQIRGSGYVVRSLEAALWCFSKAASFRETVLMASNLGDDADTTAAVAGQLAGAFYGEAGIPQAWLERLAMRNEIERFADEIRALASRYH